MFRLGCNRTERLLLIPREVDASWASSLWRLCFHNERLVQYIPTVHFYLSCCLKRISFRMPARKSITVWIQQNFIRFSEKCIHPVFPLRCAIAQRYQTICAVKSYSRSLETFQTYCSIVYISHSLSSLETCHWLCVCMVS